MGACCSCCPCTHCCGDERTTGSAASQSLTPKAQDSTPRARDFTPRARGLAPTALRRRASVPRGESKVYHFHPVSVDTAPSASPAGVPGGSVPRAPWTDARARDTSPTSFYEPTLFSPPADKLQPRGAQTPTVTASTGAAERPASREAGAGTHCARGTQGPRTTKQREREREREQDDGRAGGTGCTLCTK